MSRKPGSQESDQNQSKVLTCWAAIKLVALNFLQLPEDVQQKIYLTNAATMFGLKTA